MTVRRVSQRIPGSSEGENCSSQKDRKSLFVIIKLERARTLSLKFTDRVLLSVVFDFINLFYLALSSRTSLSCLIYSTVIKSKFIHP